MIDSLLTAIAEPRRQAILHLVWDQERSAGDIAAAFDVTFGAVSQHLKVLREANAVRMRKAGRQRFYTADKEALGPLAEHLASVWSKHLMDLKRLAEAEEKNDG